MINPSFFPSRRLALYMVRLFVTRSLAVLVALVLVLMTLDLLGESGKILAVRGNGDAELWRYVSLRIPLLISRFLPFSVLLGTLVAFVDLIRAGIVNGRAPNLIVRQMMIYDRSGGVLQRVIRVGRAIPRSGANDWLLQDVRIYDANMYLVRSAPQMLGLQGVTPAQLTIA